MKDLRARLERLEAARPPVQPANLKALEAAIAAMLRSFPMGETRDELQRLRDRIEADAMTDEDRALLGSLPACGLAPPALVGLLVDVQAKF